jgi:PIN domain nuclease of toxin-antitoxin system
VRLLIDSHALVWWREGSRALTTAARDSIADPANDVLVSIAGLWELAIKEASGKLKLPADLETIVVEERFSVLAINFDHLRRLKALPRHHRDPFDRMMIAQALAEGIPIATGDRAFARYGVQIVW